MNETLLPARAELPPPARVDAAPSLLAVIGRAACDPNVDVNKMERLIALAESIHAREAKAEYDQALNAAQAEMRPISRDCHNPQTRSKYASYEAIDSAIRPIYTAHGFGMSFGAKASATPQSVIVTCRVSHRAGHTEHVELEMPADGKGAKGNDVMTKTHATGSALSYAKRYIANLVWNLSFGEADDDGNAAGRRNSPQESTYSEPVRQAKSSPQVNPEPKQAAPAKVYELKPEPENRTPTERTRSWWLNKIPNDLLATAKQFAIAKGWMKAELLEWGLTQVPATPEAALAMIREIETYQKQVSGAPDTPNPPEFSEPFWSAIITLPRAGSKRAEYLQAPDTIRSLWDAMKSGDDKARTRLFGVAKEWQPSGWVDAQGNEHPPSAADLECRQHLDAFIEWEEKRKDLAG